MHTPTHYFVCTCQSLIQAELFHRHFVWWWVNLLTTCTNWTVTFPTHLTDILKLIKSSILHTLVMEKTEKYLKAFQEVTQVMNPEQVLPPHSQTSSYCGSPSSCEWSSEKPSLPLATWSNRYTVGCGHNHWASWGRWLCRHCQWMYHHTQGHLQQNTQHNIRSTDSERRGLHWFEYVHDSLEKVQPLSSHWWSQISWNLHSPYLWIREKVKSWFYFIFLQHQFV